MLEARPKTEQDAAQFMLGSVAPDAIHYREAFRGAAMSNIGPAKKITHLCPVSDEIWGHVTDNEGWIECVKEFLRAHPRDAFAEGFAAHVVTDIHNNKTIWNKFRTNHPEEAAKGYTSEYYNDMKKIHTRLYQEFPATDEIFALLAKAKPQGVSDIIFAEETEAIKQNLLYENFKDTPKTHSGEPHVYHFVTYDDTLEYIQGAAEFSASVIASVT